MKPIRIAQIGVNTHSHGPQIFHMLKTHPQCFEIAGYVLPEKERERLPEKMKHFDGYPELTLEQVLNDPTIEAVTVETDEIYLTKYAKLAAEAGKHIHMEKPGGADLAEFEALLDTVRAKGTVFHMGYMYRYNPTIRDLIRRVKAGELGEIVSVEAQMSCYHPLWVRQWLKELPGGMMFFLGCHLTDLILQLQGLPQRVIPLNKATGYEGITESCDFGMAVFEYKNGVSFAKTTDIERGGFLRRQLVVTGTEGTVEIRPLEVGPEAGQYCEKREVTDSAWSADGEFVRSEVQGRYDLMMESFASYVRGEQENPYSLDYELDVYKTILKTCEV
ncbi:MAG: Gfo/Idh/MocA family oxidoreductase [Clostridia bacterium]|nr:Gfo/Idh/MocA family oxidoreductase [Clostridia bacterium]